MGRLRHWVHRLERASNVRQVVITLEDGTTERFSTEDCRQNFLTTVRRLAALHNNEAVPEPHRFGVALKQAVGLPPELAKGAEAQRRLDAQIAASEKEEK